MKLVVFILFSSFLSTLVKSYNYHQNGLLFHRELTFKHEPEPEPELEPEPTPEPTPEPMPEPRCERDWECGDPKDLCNDSSSNVECLCDLDLAGNSFCWSNEIPCVELTLCDQGCPAGTRCATTCCEEFGLGMRCIPDCPNPDSGKSRERKLQGCNPPEATFPSGRCLTPQ